MYFKKMDKLYFIAEIGVKHNGDLDIAKKLIDDSNGRQWDCANIQKRNTDLRIPDNQK